MATTVLSAFNKFQADVVNLQSEESKKARNSRDWLIEQIKSFSDKDKTFPFIYEEKIVPFGSFSRNTKKRPLDDIDIMVSIKSEGSTYVEGLGTVKISVSDGSTRLKQLCDAGTNNLNSIKVVNKYVSALKTVPQYQKADTKRNQEAAVLALSSYDWDFDIVPCFFTTADIYGKSYYLIPDGSGGWKKTDPVIDGERTTAINQKHDGHVLNVIRIMKYWNKRPTMPSMSSYLLETMILNFYEGKNTIASKYVDTELPSLLEYLQSNVFYAVQDPKGIQGDINNLSWEDRVKISERAESDKNKALVARIFEQEEDMKNSINKWAEIFGNEFPDYG